MHFPGATPKDDVPSGPVTMYKAERADPNERIGSQPRQGAPDFLMVYECFFRLVRLHFPFSSFQIEILNRLEVAPSQVHPNAWGFINAFEIFCWANDWESSSNLFLYLFAPYHLSDFGFIFFRQRKDHYFFQLFEDSFPPFKDSYFKVLYTGEEYPFWTSPTGSPLFPLYWAYEHYLREPRSFITDAASLLDSDHPVIAGLREFTGKHGLIRCKVVIQSRRISRVDTLGKIILHDLLLLYKAHVAFFFVFFLC
jgi:hypothetical protein